MSHFTDNLYLRREIQRLLNENFQLKQILMEADPKAKSAEDREKEMADEMDAKANEQDAKAEAARKKAEEQQALIDSADAEKTAQGVKITTEQGFKSGKEAAKFIEDQETRKQQQDFAGFQDPKLLAAAQELGFTDKQIKAMDASNFRRYIRQVRSRAATKEQKTAQGDRQKRADDIKKAIRDGTYELTPGQQKALERGGERQLDRLAYGLAGQDQFQAGIRARRQFYDDTTDLNKYSRSAEGIVRRREMEGSMDDIGIGGAAEQYVRFRESDAAKIKAMRDREAAAETARRQRAGAFGSSMSDDELLSMASQRGMSARPGDQVRAFEALKARQQQSISSFGQQMSKLSPEAQQAIIDGRQRGLSVSQSLEPLMKRRKEEEQRRFGHLPPWTAEDEKRDAEDEKRYNDMEAAFKARTSSLDPKILSAAKAMADARSALTPDQLKRANSAEERRKHIEDIRAGRL